jgi:hypothetical protein
LARAKRPPQDDIALIVEEIPVTRFVFPDLPLNILELLQTTFQAPSA